MSEGDKGQQGKENIQWDKWKFSELLQESSQMEGT